MNAPSLVFLGIKGSVLAFEAATGRRVWVKALKGQGFVSVLVEGDCVLAATHGEVYCLAAGNGTLLWHDALKGYGYGLVSLATPNAATTPLAAAAQQEQQRQAAASAAASTAVCGA